LVLPSNASWKASSDSWASELAELADYLDAA